MPSGPELATRRWGWSSPLFLVPVLLGGLAGPAAGQEELRILPAVSSAGGVTEAGALRIVSATGQPSAVGVLEHGALRHNLGWVRWTPSQWDPDPLRIENLRVVAVTPDTALIGYSATHPVVATVAYGADEGYGSVAQTEEGVVRLTGLEAGDVVHYRLTITDEDGRERSTRDLRLCTPTVNELALGRLEASYYSGTDFQEFVTARPEATIDQPLRSDGDRHGDFSSGAGPENFSARWVGMIQITEEEDYTWHGTTDDGVRLYVDGLSVLDYWIESNRASTRRARQRLDAAWHPLRFEFFSAVGPASARLKIDGGDIPLRVVPPERLAFVSQEFYKSNFVPRDEAVTFECESPEGTGRKVVLPPEVYDCHDPNVQVASNAPVSFPYGETAVVWTATNNLDFETRFSEIVTVVDSVPPVVTPPEDVSAEAESPQGTRIQMPAVTTADACDDDLTVHFRICTDAAGAPCQACWTAEDEAADASRVAGARNDDCACEDVPARFPLGATTVTAMAYDEPGNCGAAAFDVQITDTTPPTLVTGEVQIVQCSEFQIPAIQVSDNVSLPDDILVTCLTPTDEVPGECDRRVDLGYGDHLILITAEDEAGNTKVDEVLIVQSREQVDTDPPTLEVEAAPDGFASGPVSVTVSMVDFCDDSPVLEFVPNPDATEVDGRLHSADYSAEGIYEVTAMASDAAENVRTLDVPVFGIDLTPPVATFRGVAAAPDPADRLTWPVYFAGDLIPFTAGGSDVDGAAPSGIASVAVTLTHVDTETTRTLLLERPDVDDSEPPRGLARAKNLTCDEVVPEGEDPWCDASGQIDVGGLPAGDFQLTVRVVDVAGNSHDLELFFTRITWRIAMERAHARAEELLNDDPAALVAVFLQQIPREIDAALNAVDTPALLGNGLLYSYAFAAALDQADQDGMDIGNTAYLLNRGAYVGIDAHHRYVTDELGEDDADVEQAAGYLQNALDFMEGDPRSPLASLLALMNAYFYLEHALEPFLVEDWEDATAAGHAIRRHLADYLELAAANGQEIVGEVNDHADAIHAGNLFGLALEQSEAGHAAYLELLRRLNTMSDLMVDAQDVHRVWARNWQWPLALQVRTLAGIGITLVAETLRDDPADPVNSLLAHARSQYDLGVGFMDDRLVDDALDVYIDNRCLIYEVYNLGRYRPPGVPPAEWGCPECTLNASCDHGGE